MQLLNSNIPQGVQTTRYSNKKAQDLLNLVLLCFVAFSYYKDGSPCPITRIYRFRYSSIFTRIRYLLCISLILPRQFHAKREIANDVRDRYIIFFHFVFVRTRSVRAVGSTKKQIQLRICFFVSLLYEIAALFTYSVSFIDAI